MINLLINGANMIIKHKKQQPHQNNQGGNQQNQGGWGQQNQGGWGQSNQGGWGQSNQGGWGQSNQGGWGQNQGGDDWGNNGGWGLGVISEDNRNFWGNNVDGSQWAQEQKKRNEFNIVTPQQQQSINLNQLIGEQIVFIEPSPVQKKLQQLKRLGKTFVDDMFPANQASLTGEYGADPDWSSIRWRKISEVMKSPSLFHGKIEPGDIKQGYLGDCYFLAGLAALAQRPDRIFNLFLTQELNQQRYYSVKMLYKGKWMTVDMDEYVPWLGNQPAFSRANQDQLWVVLLEKAWAKLYTSYKRIEAGYPEETLHDLTGAPIKQIVLKSATFNKEQEWQYLFDASRRQYSMVASSNPGSDTNKSVSGVVQGHAYTVLNCTTINFQGRQERIVQLRNPWGKGQFTGKWSDGDQNWNYVSAQQRQRLGFNPNKDDGIFFMPWDNFCAEFRAITVAEIDDNASYIYKSTKDKQCKGVYFAIDIAKEDLYSFQVDKTPERIYPDKYQNMFQYPQALIQIGRIQGNSCQKYQGLRSAKRTLIKKQRLPPGRYIAFVKISYNPDFEDQFDVNLAVYAATACNIQLATQQQAAIFTGNPSVQWSPQQAQDKQPWNSMGNVESGGNNNFDQGNQQHNQGGWQGQNISFGNQGNQWGQQPQQQQGGWGQDQGWGGNQQQNQWGNQPQQNQWGNQPQQQQQNQWGNQPQQNQQNYGGWGQGNW